MVGARVERISRLGMVAPTTTTPSPHKSGRKETQHASLIRNEPNAFAVRCRRASSPQANKWRPTARMACNFASRKASRARRLPRNWTTARADSQHAQAYDEVEVIRERYPDGKIKDRAASHARRRRQLRQPRPVEAVFAERSHRRRRSVRHGQARRQLDPLARQERLESFRPAAVQSLQAAVCLASHLYRRRDGRRMARRRRRQQQDDADLAHRRQAQRADDHLPAERQDLPPGQLRSWRSGGRRARSRRQDRRAEAGGHLRRRPPHRHQDRPLQTQSQSQRRRARRSRKKCSSPPRPSRRRRTASGT